jgi:hypothetical protein
MYSVFGPGVLILTRTDITPATPINIGYANEFSFEEAADSKQLYGQNEYPLDVGRSTIKLTGKAKAAVISPSALNIFNGDTFAPGGETVAVSESQNLVGTATTIAVSNASSFTLDLGVVNSATGVPLTAESAGTTLTAGEYIAGPTGTYTFAAPGGTTTLALGFTYAYNTTSGQSKIVTNKLIGVNPTFQLDYWTTRNGLPYYVRFYKGIFTKRSMDFKIDDFMMPDLEFEFMANAAGNVYKEDFAQLG